MVLRYKSLGYNMLAGEKRHIQGARKKELGITQKLLLGKNRTFQDFKGMTILMRPHNDKDEVAKASKKRYLKRTHPAKEEKRWT